LRKPWLLWNPASSKSRTAPISQSEYLQAITGPVARQ
jgi:hypothetical protein